ncbi:MAG TPA: ATP-dependent DNA helicase [Candidatus Limnocylindrales bacterium]|nr:ATP-dependent DNA helicase [Candidatus Limnocylindrales bacterium]
MPRAQNPQESSAPGISLNSAQRAAVEHGEGPLLVVAGAGTGKTRVITERIRHLLESNPSLSGENILGLTFTDKAAGEMKSRVVKAAGERAEGVWLSTFHKFCLEKILRAANPELQPIEDVDHWILLRRHIADLDLKHFRRLADPGEFLHDFVKFFSRCQDELVTPEDYDRYVASLRQKYEARKNSLDADARKDEEEALARQEELARAYRTSERLLRERNLVTFGAQLMQAVQILQSDPARLEALRGQYRYILVDEFQDTNIAQLELLWLLAGGHRNIVAVGDDDQAIYRFRGASFGSFTIFLEKFCGAARSKPRTGAKIPLVSLTQNYRSTQRILRVAHEVISHNEQSPLLPPKNLSTENPDGEKIRVVEFPRPEEEAHWVASEIERLHGPGISWRDFAVLYRKHTHRTRLLEALQRKNIPFVIRKFSILSSTLVRDLLAYLRLVDSSADNISCARVLAAPYWGVEPRDLVRLAERAEKNHRRPLLEELDSAQRELPFSREGSRVPELLSLIESLRKVAKKSSVAGVLEALIAALALAPLPSEEDRHYLDRFVEFVKEWEKKSEGKTLHDFIQYLNFFAEAGGDIHLEESLQKDAVQLMTVHAAKGLEFPHVFILHLNKRDFPSGARPVVFEFPPELMKEERPQGDFQVQEERRLFYVALTRARQRLTLSTIVNKWKKPSPFLEDFLRNGKIQKFDTAQSAPKVVAPPAEEPAGAAPESKDMPTLFGDTGEDSRAYSRVALWARAYHPPLPEPLGLSASGIETYESCPMKYLFANVWKIRGGPHASLTFGSVMHSSIKEFMGQLKQGRKMPLDELMAAYDRNWLSAGYPDEYQEEEYRREGREQLEKFHLAMCAAPPDVLFQEKTFELPLEHEIVVTGRMDQVNRLGKGKAEIVDYKTGKPKDAKKADGSLQLSVYALAAQDVLDLEPARLVFYNLTSNEPVSTERDAKSLEKTKQKISEVADQIRAGDFPARPGFLCGYCDYKPLCPAHEQLISIRPAAAPAEN